ncbi:hypothetical protein [Streptomyces sp. NPDC001508]|uniref:hypothetical protein n=1 Tax=Streptomyces sp. NPDC001508 TaxID=3154656 RepID=UPI00332B4F09
MRKKTEYHTDEESVPTAADEALKKFAERGEDDDPDEDAGMRSREGHGDPITPSPQANERAAPPAQER